MSEVCIQMLIHGYKPNICIGRECGQYNQCHGIITAHKPKQATRTIGMSVI